MLPWKRESGKRCCTRSDMVPTQQKNIQTVHEGQKTHDSQMTDHMAWTKHDMTACCRMRSTQFLLQHSREKSKSIAPAACTQLHAAFSYTLVARLPQQLSLLQPH